MLTEKEAKALKERISSLLCGEVEWTGEERFADLAEAVDEWTTPEKVYANNAERIQYVREELKIAYERAMGLKKALLVLNAMENKNEIQPGA